RHFDARSSRTAHSVSSSDHSSVAPEWANQLSLDSFRLAYEDWKAATVRFEEAVRAMDGGAQGARERAQDCARELARLHHEFLEASQPHFATSRDDDAVPSDE